MQFQENISLKPFNTFGIGARARYFTRFSTYESLTEILSDRPPGKLLILGGGSNILFTGDVDGLVMKNEFGSIEKQSEDDQFVYVKCGAGENWHQFVLHCIENGWGGLENLSLIPGNTGAAPMQNIGAYGVELKDVFHELTAFNLEERANYTFRLKDCAFGYRDSVFKNKYKDKFIIVDVVFRLTRQHRYNTSYGAIEQELEKMGVKDLSIGAISQAVINIRRSKLPDPAELGNAGSFFKNPSVTRDQFNILKKKFAGITGYENQDGSIKLAAGWLIEQCGWKGFRKGDAGVHAKQALVLVNYGNASGIDILHLSEEIERSVFEKFRVRLEREVNLVSS